MFLNNRTINMVKENRPRSERLKRTVTTRNIR